MFILENKKTENEAEKNADPMPNNGVQLGNEFRNIYLEAWGPTSL